MKKILISLISLSALGIMSVSYAQPMVCPYTDHLHISKDSPTNAHIMNAILANGNVKAKKTSKSSFNITSAKCDNSNDWFKSGTVVVTVGTDKKNKCTFTIIDGATMDNPELIYEPLCTGNFKIDDISYDGYLTYSYSIHFSKK